MDINMISHPKPAVLNPGFTDPIDFRGTLHLDGKNTLLFPLTSDLNLAFHSIMHVGNKNVYLSIQ
jgi:hypothetical protein